MRIMISVEDREGAPAYVAKCGSYPEIWSYASHFVENPKPLAIMRTWADHFEVLTGAECMADVLAGFARLKSLPHLDPETQAQVKSAKADNASHPQRLES